MFCNARKIRELYFPNFIDEIEDVFLYNKDKIHVSCIVGSIDSILYDCSSQEFQEECKISFQEAIDFLTKFKEQWSQDNPKWTVYFDIAEGLTLCARRLETDEEYEKRFSIIREEGEWLEAKQAKEKLKRQELYLKLKEEFEND